MRVQPINTIQTFSKPARISNEPKSTPCCNSELRLTNPAFKSDRGALLGMLGGAVAGLATAAVIIATGGAAAAVAAVGATGLGAASAGFGAQIGGIIGGLATGDEGKKK